jgi:hypothetical protein
MLVLTKPYTPYEIKMKEINKDNINRNILSILRHAEGKTSHNVVPELYRGLFSDRFKNSLYAEAEDGNIEGIISALTEQIHKFRIDVDLSQINIKL